MLTFYFHSQRTQFKRQLSKVNVWYSYTNINDINLGFCAFVSSSEMKWFRDYFSMTVDDTANMMKLKTVLKICLV
jgi:diadenosine tetraphosphate (Ap4A) HIT family hydrolase